MKEITIKIRKVPKDLMGKKFKKWWTTTYVVELSDKTKWEVAPNFTIDKLVEAVKEKENSL